MSDWPQPVTPLYSLSPRLPHIPHIPRSPFPTDAFLGSGNRADILVRCKKNPQFEGAPPKKTCAVDGGLEYKDCWEYEIKAWYYNFRGASTSDVCDNVVDLAEGQTAANISKTLMNAAEISANSEHKNITIVSLGTILAIAEDGVSRCELPEFRVNRPCYLADLTNLTDEQLTEQAGYLPEGQRHLHFGSPFFPSINGHLYGGKGFDMHDGVHHSMSHLLPFLPCSTPPTKPSPSRAQSRIRPPSDRTST